MQMKSSRSFAVIIVSHNRPDRIVTLKALSKEGYTGRIIILIDDEDKSSAEYHGRYPGMVRVFSKKKMLGSFDLGDNIEKRNTVTFARNATWDIARSEGLTHFLILDDDYTDFRYKFDDQNRFTSMLKIRNLDSLFSSTLDFLDSSGAICVAYAQGGDFIGGGHGNYSSAIRPTRKCMNTFFCRTDRPFKFTGRMNEDVNTYVMNAIRGKLMFTVNMLAVNQTQTQANAGGLTDMYLQFGTYMKSMYTVMYAPSCCVVTEMGTSHRRLHHKIAWRNCAPKIIEESVRKPRNDA
jgi:hypothetical protein